MCVVLLCAVSSAFIVVCAVLGTSVWGCTKAGAYIDRAQTCCKYGWAAASLWLSLDLGDRHSLCEQIWQCPDCCVTLRKEERKPEIHECGEF